MSQPLDFEIKYFDTMQIRFNCRKSRIDLHTERNDQFFLFADTQKMGFNPMKWKTRTIMHGILGVLVLYTLFVYKKKHQVMFEGIIKKSDPRLVWEFVADFSNMKKLNPTM